MSQFSQELCKLKSSNLVYPWKMSDCIVQFRLVLIAHVLPFLSIFLSLILSALKIFVIVFSGAIEARTFKLDAHLENKLLYCRSDKHANYSSHIPWGGRVVQWCRVNFQCRGVLLIWIRVGQGPTALAVGAGGSCLDSFTLVYHFSFLSPSL